jgi:hypothetical protein
MAVGNLALRDAALTRETARRSIALYGGIVSGILALMFFLVAALVGVPFLPSASGGPYGTVLNLAHLVIWFPCLIVTTVNVPEFLNFTLIVHAVATAIDIGAWITLLAFAYMAVVSGNTTAALHVAYVGIVLSVQLVLSTLTTVSLWRLGRNTGSYMRL